MMLILNIIIIDAGAEVNSNFSRAKRMHQISVNERWFVNEV